MGLQEQLSPKCSFADLVLPESVTAAIQGILEDHEYQDALREENLPVRRTILLHGPPGCGKTSIAHALAKAMDLRLFVASFAEIVCSHVGESEKNVENLFRFAGMNKCIMLLDEFDSIGMKRSLGQEAANLADNRVTNTLLTCLENRIPQGLIVACTNLQEAIDLAVIRRFDLVVEVPRASREMLKKVAESIIRGRFGISIEEILAKCSTPAAVVQCATDQLRRAVIEREKAQRAETLPLFDPPEEIRKIRDNIMGAST